MPTTTQNSSSNSTIAEANSPELSQDVKSQTTTSKNRAFWMCFVAVMVTEFLAALDLTAVGTAAGRGDYIWVGSAYALSSTAFIPLSGNLADIFGRKPVELLSIAFFAVGSALAGAAQNMPMMIAARGVQGIGGGGILTSTHIITADLIPLAERGRYQGMLSMFIGPPIGGALSSQGTKAWRWLFYLNLPLSGIATALVVRYLSVNRPKGSVRSKLAEVDWVGNALVIVGTGLAIIGMTWGGIRYPWRSVEVLAPMVVGLSLLIAFGIYEAKIPARPTIPLDVIGNRTSLSALLSVAVHGITSITMIYYLPVFFQACFGASPIRSAVDFLPGTLITVPFALLAGVTIGLTKKYRPVNWAGWCITIVGYGLVSMLREDSSVGQWVGYQIVGAIGVGLIFSAPIFPLLAPLPNSRSASALAFYSFIRSFSQTWGMTISSTILQNTLKRKLPPAFVAQFPPGFEIAYAAIPVIRRLEPPLRNQVQAAFADSMAPIWQVMIGFAGLGLLCSFLMAEVHMTTTVDENYTLKETNRKLESPNA